MFISEYRKFLFCVSEISILDIPNKMVVLNYYFGYPKHLFLISKITISQYPKTSFFDIRNKHFLL